MALKLNGRDDRLTRRDFMALARTIGLPQGDADATITQLTGALANVIEEVRLPAFTAEIGSAATVQDEVLALTAERRAAL